MARATEYPFAHLSILNLRLVINFLAEPAIRKETTIVEARVADEAHLPTCPLSAVWVQPIYRFSSDRLCGREENTPKQYRTAANPRGGLRYSGRVCFEWFSPGRDGTKP